MGDCTKTENYFRKSETYKLFLCSLALIQYIHQSCTRCPGFSKAHQSSGLTAVPLSEAVTRRQKAKLNIASGEDVHSILCLCFL